MIGDIAHVCNRGVEKRKVFIDQNDYSRFANDLFLLNNKSGKIRTRKKNDFKSSDFKREKLVDVLKWSLLPNHYHLLLHEVVDGGVSEFVRRLGNAYTKYFNTKNNGRSGYLFQNKAQIIPITEESQFLYIPFYIDLNVLDIKFRNWKSERPVRKKAQDFLKSYRWSSYKDYFANGEMDYLVDRDVFYELFDFKHEVYEKDLFDFMSRAHVSTWYVDTEL